MRGWWSVAFGALALIGSGSGGIAHAAALGRPGAYPSTPRAPVADTLHGTVIVDDYRWLEDGADPRVVAWTKAQNRLSRAQLDALPQRSYLVRRYNELWRYDDEGVPQEMVEGDRVFRWTKKWNAEKWVFEMRADASAPYEVLIDPNTWPANDQLADAGPSRDGRLVAFGRAHGGDENPKVRVLEVATGRVLPDTLQGRKQYVTGWLPDGSGLYYTANPTAGSVPPGEEYYWPSVYLHRLGTPGSTDRKVFGDEKVKELFHSIDVSVDGRYEFFYRSRFSFNEVFFRPVGSDAAPTPLATGFDASYGAWTIGDRIFILTNSGAPRFQVFVTDPAHPDRKDWRVFLPEDPKARLETVSATAGRFYAVYEENAHTVIRVYDPEGRYLRDLALPGIGSAGVSGLWSKSNVWVTYESFTEPSTIFRYDFDADRLDLYHATPLKLDTTPYTTEQVWYPSKDGTQVSMFLVGRKDRARDGSNPTLLTGYGGFDASMTPYFSTTYIVWLQAGGMIAIPNLRGGGEYGREWHEAGKREKKQNVFDDFLAAADWLIAQGYTRPGKLVIEGGSNGGLLVGAALVQRPELFRAVVCQVPLLDMVRYQKFGLANIWSEEYGSSDDPAQFRYLYAYSPYHHVVDGTRYPAILFTASENDARVDPMHARKMTARLQVAGRGGGPVLLEVHPASGHGGGTTLSTKIQQTADTWAFLMDALGMAAPQGAP
jgi:prolyl oligopeptidase